MAAESPKFEHLQTLLETFKCYICMNKIQDAHMCPHCSKLCCYSCIYQWLTRRNEHIPQRPRRFQPRSQCPHCRATLHLGNIVKCRWIGDLSEELDSLCMTEITKNKDSRCEIHNEHTEFCRLCNMTICHQCALIDNYSAHKNHWIGPIENSLSDKLEERYKLLKTKQIFIKQDIKQLEKNIIEVKQIKGKQIKKLNTSIKDLEKKFGDELAALMARKNRFINEYEEIDELLQCFDAQPITIALRIKKMITALQIKPTYTSSQQNCIIILVYLLITFLIGFLFVYPSKK